MRVLVVLAHPEPRSLNGALARHASAHLSASGHVVETSDLYAMGWRADAGPGDFPARDAAARLDYASASKTAFEGGTQLPEVVAEQQKLLAADAIVLQFPLWWFGLPAILKGWVDRVFACGFAYGVRRPGGSKWGERYGSGNLEGKRALLSVTTGAPAPQFGRRGIHGPIEDLLFPTLHGICFYTGMAVLPPFLVHGAARLREAEFADVAARLGARLDGLFSDEPIPFRTQNGGDYDDDLVLRDEVAPGATGFAAHRR